MSRKPFSDLAYSEFSLGDGLGDEFVSRDSLQFEIQSVDTKKSIGGSQADSLVAIEKSMIVGKRFHERRCFVDEVVVVAILRAENGCLKKTLIPNSVNTPEFVDELTVHFDDFCHRQIEIARRDILFRGHEIYLASS